MTNMVKFDASLKRFSRRMDENVATMMRFAAADTFDEIFRQWPEDTAWSLANHRINLDNAETFDVVPSIRPKHPGALSGDASANAEEQINKLSAIQPYTSLRIGNAVDYADSVGFEPGNGLFIYKEAARSAALTAPDRFSPR